MLHGLALVLALAPSTFVTQTPTPKPEPALVRVFVSTADSGEPTELADRLQSVKDLAESLAGKKKTMVVVEDEDDADVTLEVLFRGINVPRVVIGIGARPGQPPGMNGPLRTVVLRVKLTHGDDVVQFANKNKPAESARGWKSAADDLAGQIDKWIKDRRAAILGHRGG